MTFNKNVGSFDQKARLIIGILLIIPNVMGYFSQPLSYGAWAFSAILIVTAWVGFCPIYSLLGINSCSRQLNK